MGYIGIMEKNSGNYYNGVIYRNVEYLILHLTLVGFNITGR